jgi:hypothetical protein
MAKKRRGLKTPAKYLMGARRSFLEDGLLLGTAAAGAVFFMRRTDPQEFPNTPQLPLVAGALGFLIGAFGAAIFNEER